MFRKLVRYSTVTSAVGFALWLNPALSLGETKANQLSREEELSGWKLLFDGSSTDNWRNYKADKLSDSWQVVDGELVRRGSGAGDIVTKDQYKYFELLLEYKISKGGNSGLMFHVTEDNPAPWHSGPEIQIQDNVDGRDPQKSGWLYQLYQPTTPPWINAVESLDKTRPVGEWNQLYLRIAPNQCEVSMNGAVYYNFQVGNNDWNQRVAKSKFASMAGFGKAGKGHICLQDHGDLVSFRNIKIREIPDNGVVKQPIDGVLAARGEPAFPNLKWEGWAPRDEDGNPTKPLRILELTYANGFPKRLFAMDQRGWIFTFENRRDVETATRFLNIESKVSPWNGPGANEQGLLGLAFHPKFKDNGEFFVSYTRKKDDTSVIARYRVMKDNPLIADPESEEILLELPQPYKNHNGGPIEFGPDGFLYIAFGDGGLRNDPVKSGQDRNQWLGSLLRIDVDTKSPGLNYGIPADNPFVNATGIKPETYAYGFRNPWRIAFDKASGRLWLGDVGQDLYEEVNVVEKGGNYGWSDREGSAPFGNNPPVAGVGPYIEPVWQYDHMAGKSITGGRVFNSSRIPELKNKYIYADYVSGAVWALSYDPATGKATRNEQLIAGGVPIFAFGEDQEGEVYYSRDTNRSEVLYRFEVDPK
jgi:glucose/arabinose dehydrogenase